MRLGRALIAFFVAGLTLGAAPPASALQRQPGMDVSRDDPKTTHTYDDPIIANNTSLHHRPSDCRTATFCDVIELTIDSTDFERRDVYFVNITMSWPQEYNEEEGVQSNDLDLYIYDSQELRIGQAATSNEKEKTQLDLPATDIYYLVVNNFAGPNLGYTFELEMVYQGKLKEVPEFVRATPQASEPPPSEDRPDPAPLLPTAAPSPAPETDLEPEATLAPIVTPGPDGAPTTLSLEAVQASGEIEGGGLSWWATTLIVGFAVAAGGGLSFFVYRRFRARGA